MVTAFELGCASNQGEHNKKKVVYKGTVAYMET